MEDRWATSEEYGYAYIIPIITGYFVWQNKIKLQQVEYELSWVGGLLLLFGIFLILSGVLSATNSFTQFGYIVSLISTTFLFMGWGSDKAN